MKLIELLVEGELDIFRQELQTGLNPQSGSPEMISELQTQLARHTIYIGQANGIVQTQGPAWTAPIDGIWSPALSNAIVEWKKSVNRQMGEDVLSTTPDIGGRQAVIYLLNTELYDQGSQKGLLKIGKFRTRTTPFEQPSMDGTTYTGRLAEDSDANVIDTRTFVNAIGASGWLVILNNLATAKGLKDQNQLQEIRRAWPIVFSAYQQFPDKWRSNWEQKVIRSQTGLQATMPDGSKYAYNAPGVAGLGPEAASKKLYNYFAMLAKGLFEVERTAQSQAQAQAETVKSGGATIEGPQTEVWVISMKEALDNSVIAILPGGRSFSIDSESVQDLMNKLRTAEDWENVSKKYADMYSADLSQRLVEEIPNDMDYKKIVRLPLQAIGRTNPDLFHASINFDESISIEVDAAGSTFIVYKEKQNGVVSVGSKQGNSTIVQVRDAIIEDTILRTAIDQTGGTIPDTNIKPTVDNLRTAMGAFTVAVQENYPEMVAFYTAQDPFDQAQLNIGTGVMMGKIDRGAKLANYYSEAQLIDWFTNEIKKDRDVLVGTEEDPESAAINIYFHPSYLNEGKAGRYGIQSRTDDVNQEELTAEEEEVIQRLFSNDEEVQNLAADEILETIDTGVNFYDKIYRLFPIAHGGVGQLDEYLGGDEIIPAMLEGSGMGDEPILARFVEKYGMCMAAPFLLAKYFRDAIKGLGTDDDALDRGIAQIQNKNDYDNVNEYYKQLGGAEDLIDDIDEENVVWFGKDEKVEALANKIGRGSSLELSRANIPSAISRSLNDFEREASLQNIRTLTDAFKANKDEIDDVKADLLINRLQEVISDNEIEQEVKDVLSELKDMINDHMEEVDPAWYAKAWRGFSGWFDYFK